MNAVTAFSEAGEQANPSPANVEAEASLLGLLLRENDAVDAVADLLRPADFSVPMHGRIYEAVLANVMRGQTASPVTIKGAFDNDPDLAMVGGSRYLIDLTGDYEGSLVGAPHLAQIIRDAARRRSILAQIEEARLACLDPGTEVSAIAELVSHVAVDGADDGLVEANAGSCVEAHLKALREGSKGITCNRIPEFDRLAGALLDKHFVLVAARPGMGKTAFACSYAIGAARQGHGVLFISLEMSGEDLGGRLASDMCFGLDGEGRVPYSAIAEGTLDEWQHKRVVRAAGELFNMPLEVIDAPSMAPSKLAHVVRRHKRRFEARGTPLRLVIVDYLQRMKADRQRQKTYEEVSEISRALKDIAKENSICLMALAQLNRDVERRGDKRPGLADLRDSGQLEQDADTVIFLLRQEYYHRQAEPDALSPEWPGWKDALDRMTGEIEFIMPKRRGGATGSAKGVFHAAFQAVR
jgi:replicative DNA helicase